jgi:hypothetical protein
MTWLSRGIRNLGYLKWLKWQISENVTITVTYYTDQLSQRMVWDSQTSLSLGVSKAEISCWPLWSYLVPLLSGWLTSKIETQFKNTWSVQYHLVTWVQNDPSYNLEVHISLPCVFPLDDTFLISKWPRMISGRTHSQSAGYVLANPGRQD